MTAPALMIATPHTRPLFGQYVESLMLTQWDGPLIWKHLADVPVAQARERLAEMFLYHELQPEWLLFADSDATWAPDAVKRMASHGKDVVAASMYWRGLPPILTIGHYDHTDPSGDKVYVYHKTMRALHHLIAHGGLDEKVSNTLVINDLPRGSLLEPVDGVGMHFTLIRRRVLEITPQPWFQSKPGMRAGEDYYFCEKVAANGHEIYWDKGVHTGHIIGEGLTLGLKEYIAFSKYVKGEEFITSKE